MKKLWVVVGDRWGFYWMGWGKITEENRETLCFFDESCGEDESWVKSAARIERFATKAEAQKVYKLEFQCEYPKKGSKR